MRAQCSIEGGAGGALLVSARKDVFVRGWPQWGGDVVVDGKPYAKLPFGAPTTISSHRHKPVAHYILKGKPYAKRPFGAPAATPPRHRRANEPRHFQREALSEMPARLVGLVTRV